MVLVDPLPPRHLDHSVFPDSSQAASMAEGITGEAVLITQW